MHSVEQQWCRYKDYTDNLTVSSSYRIYAGVNSMYFL